MHETKNVDSRCKALTKKSKPCRAAATESGLCFFHSNPNKAAELGRIGGRSKLRNADNLDPLPKLDNAGAVRDTVARLIDDLYAGKLHPRIATCLAPLLNLQLRTIETTSIEQRLANVERRMAEICKDESVG